MNPQEDVKSLWERWAKTPEEDGPSDLVKGYNLVGVGLIIAGSLFQCLGSGILQYRVGPGLYYHRGRDHRGKEIKDAVAAKMSGQLT